MEEAWFVKIEELTGLGGPMWDDRCELLEERYFYSWEDAVAYMLKFGKREKVDKLDLCAISKYLFSDRKIDKYFDCGFVGFLIRKIKIK